MLSNNQKLQEFVTKSNQESELVSELKRSKNVVKKLIELKKSVGNIYENYENVL